jgi:hypothetical protein
MEPRAERQLGGFLPSAPGQRRESGHNTGPVELSLPKQASDMIGAALGLESLERLFGDCIDAVGIEGDIVLDRGDGEVGIFVGPHSVR